MGYDVAQVCLNGHVTNSTMRGFPQFNQKHCDNCGSPTIHACANCQTPIRGQLERVISIGFAPPAFCHNCGKPFPWTVSRQQAAIDLFLDEIQDEQARKQFEDSIDHITKDTPQSTVASNRVVKLLTKTTKGTANAIRDILVDIASETAKKIIFPQ